MTLADFKNLSFEDALQELEKLVQDLEGGRIKLDDAVEAYEKATALKKFCDEKLKAAQLKVEKLEIDAQGSQVLKPLDKIEE